MSETGKKRVLSADRSYYRVVLML